MEMIDRTALLNEIYHGKDKPTIYDRADFADWILECIQKAPEITGISETAEGICPEQIQAGMTVYVVTRHIIHDRTTGTSHSFKDIAKCTVEKVVKKSDIIKYRVNGHFTDGEFYSSTITEKGIGKMLFIDEDDAKKVLKGTRK